MSNTPLPEPHGQFLIWVYNAKPDDPVRYRDVWIDDQLHAHAAAVSAAKDAEIAALREALQGLMVGCKYYNIQGQWHWHEKAVATNEALDAARAALGDKNG